MNTLRHCVSAGEPLNEEVLLVFQGLRGGYSSALCLSRKKNLSMKRDYFRQENILMKRKGGKLLYLTRMVFFGWLCGREGVRDSLRVVRKEWELFYKVTVDVLRIYFLCSIYLQSVYR